MFRVMCGQGRICRERGTDCVNLAGINALAGTIGLGITGEHGRIDGQHLRDPLDHGKANQVPFTGFDLVQP